jgi:imidazoleglycerol-phosphate dehydratase
LKKRVGEVARKTKETDITVRVVLDGTGRAEAKTGVAFLDHMLHSLATHSLMDVTVRAKGDLQHHVVEDVAITLGKAIGKALGDRAGIRRFGDAIVPMDDGLALAAVDLVKRPYSAVDLKLKRVMLEDAPKEDLEHFFGSIAQALEATVHIKVLDGSNDHHKFEAAVKAFALALREAVAMDPRRAKIGAPPSSKGSM